MTLPVAASCSSFANRVSIPCRDRMKAQAGTARQSRHARRARSRHDSPSSLQLYSTALRTGLAVAARPTCPGDARPGPAAPDPAAPAHRVHAGLQPHRQGSAHASKQPRPFSRRCLVHTPALALVAAHLGRAAHAENTLRLQALGLLLEPARAFLHDAEDAQVARPDLGRGPHLFPLTPLKMVYTNNKIRNLPHYGIL
jgi:hypothetical protein